MNTNIDRLDFATPCTLSTDCDAPSHRVVTFLNPAENRESFTACQEHWLGWILWYDRQRAQGQRVIIIDVERIGTFIPKGTPS